MRLRSARATQPRGRMAMNETWLTYSGSARCPSCGGVVQIGQFFQPKPLASYSLAGVQTTLTGSFIWKYRCTVNPDHTGAATPKTDGG